MKAKLAELRKNIEAMSEMIKVYSNMADKAVSGVSKNDAELLKDRMKFLKQEILKTNLYTKESIREIKSKELPKF